VEVKAGWLRSDRFFYTGWRPWIARESVTGSE